MSDNRSQDELQTALTTHSRVAFCVFGLIAAVGVVSGCAGSGGTANNVLPSSSNDEPGSPGTLAVRGAIGVAAAGRKSLSKFASPPSQSLCIGGTSYQTVQDDEFSQDSSLNYTPNLLTTTPAPNGAIWSSRANGFASDHSRNNVGTDDAYYTDPTRGFGGYSPYSFSGGALNITAVPVPSPYATASPLLQAHWLSGLLESPALTYGYVEISAKIPNLQGWWPAPLWLLGLYGDDGKGDGYEELDVNELFGNVLPKSTVQQTQIFSQSGNPPANLVRTVVSPDPSTVFHSYGVLWTPQDVRYYIDRVETSPAFPNAANGPANAIISLAVFTDHTWGPPPVNQTPKTMSLQYYRWYQTTNANCSPTIVPTALPTATPTPKPEGTGVPSILQNSGVLLYPTKSMVLGQFGRAPSNGDVLIAYLDTWTPVATPTGWTRVDSPNNNGFVVFTGVVGQNGLSAATSYPFGLNWGIIDVLDVGGASLTNPIIVSSDPDQWQSQFPRSLTVPATHGLLLSTWGGMSSLNGFNYIDDQLPSGQSSKVIAYSLNNYAGACCGSYSLKISKVTSEPYLAPNPFTDIGTISAVNWGLNGDVLWIPSDQ